MMKSTDRFISSEARQESKAVMINSIISGVDKVAIEMERKWGINRLRMLVPDADREKFDRQTANFDMAIGTSDTNEIRLHADSIKLAWAALDEIANAAGAEILKPDIWEIRLPGSGDIVAFVRTEAEAYRLARDGQAFSRHRSVFPSTTRTTSAPPGPSMAVRTGPHRSRGTAGLARTPKRRRPGRRQRRMHRRCRQGNGGW